MFCKKIHENTPHAYCRCVGVESIWPRESEESRLADGRISSLKAVFLLCCALIAPDSSQLSVRALRVVSEVPRGSEHGSTPQKWECKGSKRPFIFLWGPFLPLLILRGLPVPFSALRWLERDQQIPSLLTWGYGLFACILVFLGNIFFLAMIIKYLDSAVSDFSGDAFSHLLNCVNFEKWVRKGGWEREELPRGCLLADCAISQTLIVVHFYSSRKCLSGGYSTQRAQRFSARWFLSFRSS